MRRARRRGPWPLLLLLALAALVALPGSARASPAAAALAPAPPDELLVTFHPWVGWEEQVASVRGLGLQVVRHYRLSPTMLVRLPSRSRLEAARARLLDSGLVRAADPNYAVQVAQVRPDDPEYQTAQEWYFDLIGAPDAWEITTGSREVVVALIDGAVALDHPDLRDNIWANAGEVPDNGQDDDGNGYVDDIHGYDFIGAHIGPGSGPPSEDSDPGIRPGEPAAGDGLDQDNDGEPDGAVGHGTRVASILAAVGNNGYGLAGVVWQTTIMPVRVTSAEGNGFFSSVIQAVEYAVLNGADVINISLAAAAFPEAAGDAINAAVAAGVIVVAAAGNSGFSVAFPAAVEGVIAVGSHGGADEADERAWFSPSVAGVDYVAFGDGVPVWDIAPISGDPFLSTAVGTSFSAPFVTGAVVLIKALYPEAGPAEVRQMLDASAVDLPDGSAPAWDGRGRVHLGRLVLALSSGRPPRPAVRSAETTATAVHVVGVAPGATTVTLTDETSGAVLASGVVGSAGDFALSVPLSGLPETAHQLALIAVAHGASGLRSEPAPVFTVALPRDVVLVPGWNLVAWAGPPASGEEILATLPVGVRAVFAWNGQSWDVAHPGRAFPRIARVETGQGLWLLFGEPLPTVWRQSRASFQAATLRPGWQLIAWAGGSAGIANAAAGSSPEVRAIYRWEPWRQAFEIYRRDLPQGNTLTALRHFEAVWVLAEAPGGPWPGP